MRLLTSFVKHNSENGARSRGHSLIPVLRLGKGRTGDVLDGEANHGRSLVSGYPIMIVLVLEKAYAAPGLAPMDQVAKIPRYEIRHSTRFRKACPEAKFLNILTWLHGQG